ncbi:MAG: hypothetical protein J6S80_04160 [Alphaproteobacteria bacterium]|nr:hypothetical protein [Alphaproteobacteria bacterium]
MKRPTPYKIEKEKQETYELNVQNLMNLIPNATVAKQIDEEKSGRYTKRIIKWYVGNSYAVYSSKFVYAIANDGTEDFKFFMKSEDYKKFEEACEARRQELFGKKQKNK